MTHCSQKSKRPASYCIKCTRRRAIMPVIPLLFIRFSQNRPLRVSNPIRYNRRNPSQPYPPPNLTSQCIYPCIISTDIPTALTRCAARKPSSRLCRIIPLTFGTFSVKQHKMYSLRHCVFPFFHIRKGSTNP